MGSLWLLEYRPAVVPAPAGPLPLLKEWPHALLKRASTRNPAVCPGVETGISP
jgi:hypothetical protein